MSRFTERTFEISAYALVKRIDWIQKKKKKEGRTGSKIAVVATALQANEYTEIDGRPVRI